MCVEKVLDSAPVNMERLIKDATSRFYTLVPHVVGRKGIEQLRDRATVEVSPRVSWVVLIIHGIAS